MKNFSEFLTNLAARESGGSYTVVNQYGYLGKYQVGEASLIDTGYYKKDGTSTNDWKGEWTGKDGVWSKDDFLSKAQAQENAIRAYIDKQWGYIEKLGLDKFVGKTLSDGTLITESGLIAGAHLKGVGGLQRYLKSDGVDDNIDGNGTRISSYVRKFSGYYMHDESRSSQPKFVETSEKIATINTTDPMGSDDGKSIMDAASPGSTKRPDENYSHEGRTSPAIRSADAKIPSAPLPKPPPGPAGDAIDADLPDGTRVVSTSITVNGQTTVTAQLIDKAGQVLLSAGAGQTMERDPDTGIVQVRTGTSDHMQQFDPATGEVTQAFRTGSDTAHFYQNLLDAFSNPQSSAGEGEQLVDASGGLPEASKQAMGDALSDHLETQGVSKFTQAQASAMFNSLMAVNNWDHLSDLGKLSAMVNLYNVTDKLGGVFGATGNNLPGDLGAAAGYLQLLQGLQSGDDLVIANSINVLSDHALDSAMNQAFGTTAAGEAVPYLSYALAIRNFADNPEQAMLTAAGCSCLGEAVNNAHLRKAA